jgi:hypothetical protein
MEEAPVRERASERVSRCLRPAGACVRAGRRPVTPTVRGGGLR